MRLRIADGGRMGLRMADGGWRMAKGRAALFAVVLLLMRPSATWAQVGHAPEGSPYRDLRAKQAASVIGGFLRGGRGAAQASPSNGPIFGVRYDRQVGGPVEILLGLSYARLDKYLVDATAPVASRLVGPVRDDLVLMEAGLSLVLTGRKSWRGFVPYVGGMVGVVFETDLATFNDFTFGTRAVLTPHAGLKWYPVQALAFKVEARDIIWRVRYPDSWFNAQVVGIPPVLPAATQEAFQWLHHPTVMISLGYTFTF
jgi:hypothetical protein